MRTLAAATLFTTALTAVGCAGMGNTSKVETAFSAPRESDSGVVIAESFMVPGTTHATSVVGTADDCAGPGLGIRVDSSVTSGNFLYDKNGEPCEAAQTVFDGRTPVGRRAADPAIALTFYDQTGPLPNMPDDLAPLPAVKVNSQLYKGQTRRAGVGAPGGDPLLATLTRWEHEDTSAAARLKESDEAALRNLQNIAGTAQTEAESRDQLLAMLRERERQIESDRRRNEETLQRSLSNRAKTTAAQTAWQQRENELQAELEATRKRLDQFQQLNQRLAAERSVKEQAYKNKINNLSADLRVAETQAEESRRDLIIKAAAKIAEAEQLAHAAQLQEQDAQLREAARLKREAESMMDRALAMNAVKGTKILSAIEPHAAPPMDLLKTPVVVHAKQQTLKQILDGVLVQVQPQAGKWQADWQLSGTAQKLLSQKWSLTAEAPLEQVLAQLQQQVEGAEGIKLTFSQFHQSRLLVITDATAPK